jgi:hypothetical protein
MTGRRRSRTSERCGLHLVADRVSQADFREVAGDAMAGAPHAEGGAETVRRQIVAAHPLQERQHGHIGQRLAPVAAREHEHGVQLILPDSA